MKTRFIVNPRSGRVRRALPAVQAFAAARLAEVVLTERPRHATELARQALADGCQLVVAVGGDGTINEIATVLAASHALLGLVPCGSGNGLGRTLGIHGSIDRALRILVEGRPRTIDTATADGRAFFVTAGLGFEAVVSEEFNRHSVRGLPRYLLTAAQTWRAYQPETCVISCNGLRESRRVFTLTVANCDQYGNGARIAPGALPDDGVLDLTAIPPTNWRNGPALAARLFLGSLNHRADVLRMRSTRFVVERSRPGPIHVDGELHQAGASVAFEIRPRTLRVLAPAPDEFALLPVGSAELATAP